MMMLWPFVYAFQCLTGKFDNNNINNNNNILSVTLEGEQCYVKPYFKPPTHFFIMMGQSRHPLSVFKGLTKGEKIRI